MAACSRLAPWIKHLQRKTPCCCVGYRSDRFISQEVETATVKNVIPKGEIKLPLKKKRDSLSILKALASTVEPVRGTAYNEEDDPYFMYTFFDKGILPLSKASGQRTARYFVNKYRNAFEHDDVAPFVQSFQPDASDYKFTTPCEEAIRERISRREVMKAGEVYLKMKQQDMEVSDEVKLELLEILCYYNSVDPQDDRYPLEAYHAHFNIESEGRPWASCEDVFNDLTEKTEDAYNWMVQNYVMKNDFASGREMLEKMKKTGVPCHRNTYHEIFRKLNKFKNHDQEYTSILKELAEEMGKAGHQCNLETFQCVISGLPKNNHFFTCLPRVLADMKSLDLEPDYQTWSLISEGMADSISEINCRLEFIRNSAKMIIHEAIEHLKAHPEEMYISTACFFQNAMEVCKRIDDRPLALEVHNYKDSLGNKHVPKSEPAELKYYTILFDLLAYTESCETIMKIYNKSFGKSMLSTAPFRHILSALDTFKEYQHVPKLFDDFLQRISYFPSGSIINEVVAFLNIIVKQDHPEEMMSTFLQQNLYLFQMLKKDLNTKGKATFGWDLVTLMIAVFLKNNDLATAWECFTTSLKNPHRFNRFLWDQHLQSLLEKIIEEGDTEKFKELYEKLDPVFHYSLDIEAYREQLSTMFTTKDINEMISNQRQTPMRKSRY